MNPRILTPHLAPFASAAGMVPITNPAGSDATDCIVFESRSERCVEEKIPSIGTDTTTEEAAE